MTNEGFAFGGEDKTNNINTTPHKAKKSELINFMKLLINDLDEKEFFLIKEFIFQLVVLVNLEHHLLKSFQKGFIQELIHKIHCQHL